MTRLKHERRTRHLSQAALGHRVGLHQSDISLIERGILIPTLPQLERLATSLNVAPGELLKEVVVIVEVAR